ncbi:VOC family protein [Brucellaceae bacterium C25G]
MKLGYTITYVADVAASLQFFSSSFGFKTRFLHEGGDYGELETGETTLAFANLALADTNFDTGIIVAQTSEKPLGMEVALVTTEVEAFHAKAISYGAQELAAPKQKPWGQTVSYLRSPDGILIELCTPVGG